MNPLVSHHLLPKLTSCVDIRVENFRDTRLPVSPSVSKSNQLHRGNIVKAIEPHSVSPSASKSNQLHQPLEIVLPVMRFRIVPREAITFAASNRLTIKRYYPQPQA